MSSRLFQSDSAGGPRYRRPGRAGGGVDQASPGRPRSSGDGGGGSDGGYGFPEGFWGSRSPEGQAQARMAGCLGCVFTTLLFL